MSRSKFDTIEPDSELPTTIAGASAVKNPGDGRVRVDPYSGVRKAKRNDQRLTGEHGYGGAGEQTSFRKIEHPVGDETKVSQSNDLAGDENRMTGRSRRKDSMFAHSHTSGRIES